MTQIRIDEPRAAILSVHTSPIDQPGTGDSGGMNVYIRSVATRLEERGVDVDLFTRCRGGVDHETKHLTKHAHVVSIKAGPCEPIPKTELPRYLPEFLGGVIRHAKMNGRRYDVVHSHYWLSGWVGQRAAGALGRAARLVVPHARQGEELLARARASGRSRPRGSTARRA